MVLRWQEHHAEILKRGLAMEKLPPDSLAEFMFHHRRFDFTKLLGQYSLVTEVPTNTSWETAKSTGIISEFDYETVIYLTKVYDLQDNIMYNTLPNLLQLMSDRKTHLQEYFSTTLVLYNITMHELMGQETLLIDLYSETLGKMN